jgi:hypothetical protein
MEKQVLFQQQIEEELINAEKAGRPANFSNKTLSSFSLFNEIINTSLIFDNSKIEGQVFLGDVYANGDISFKNCLIKGSLYLANIKLSGDLILENATIEGAINLVGAEIQKDILANNLQNQGFFSLAKAKIKGNLFLEKSKTKNAFYNDFAVKGDMIMEGSSIGETLNLRGASIDGMLDLDEIAIGKDLILEKTNFKKTEAENIDIKGRTIN